MLDCYATSGGSRQAAVLQALDVLLEHDKTTGNDNLRILDILPQQRPEYYQHRKEMNLHRNSVIYRWIKIEQLWADLSVIRS
jgi:sugar diacid utilization regulator